jgi:hypothetical protein
MSPGSSTRKHSQCVSADGGDSLDRVGFSYGSVEAFREFVVDVLLLLLSVILVDVCLCDQY